MMVTSAASCLSGFQMHLAMTVWIRRPSTRTGRLCGRSSSAARRTSPLCSSHKPAALTLGSAVVTWDLSKSLVPVNRMPRTKT